MQTVWSGKGDNKLTYKSGLADGRPGGEDDLPHAVLRVYGRMCTEEKFTVLPSDVRLSIARTVDAWVKRNPANRLCVADCMVGSLTLLAHGTHQIYRSFDRFLTCNMDDAKLLRALRCYKNCVPEPGTYLGEIVAQFFQHCKQQSNLNVKRTTARAATAESGGGKGGTRSTPAAKRRKLGIEKEDEEVSDEDDDEDEDEEEEEEARGRINDENEDAHHQHRRSQDAGREKCKKSDIDRKFEVIMSLKKVATVVLMFRCTQERRFADGDDDRDVRLKAYLKRQVFGTLVTKVEGANLLDQVSHEFSVKQFENEPQTEVYFSLTVYRERKHDAVLDGLFTAVDRHNRSIHEHGVRHRIGVCDLVYCSDTLYFMDMSQTLFIDNSVTFLYCFLTEKYRPVIETKEDSFVFGLVKILSSIEYFTKCSLKRNHNSRMGHGPLTAVISEGGLNESTKYVKALYREAMLRDDGATPQQPPPSYEDYVPTSPTYAPQSPPQPPPPPTPDRLEDDNDQGGKKETRRYYAINEPYINTFLNRPVECGAMY